MNKKALIGLIITALAFLAPSVFGVSMPEDVQLGLTSLGVGIFGFFAKEENPFGSSILTTILGILPAVVWVAVYIFKAQIAPELQYNASYAILVVVGVLTKAPDLSEVLKKLKEGRR